MPWNAKNGSVPMDGAEMDYVSFGSGEKKLIVLPGLSDGLATVKGKALLLISPYLPYLKDYTVYMFSRKNGLAQNASIRDMAADQARALQLLGIGKTNVLGVSQGGMIAQQMAVDFPETVEKLVIAVSAPGCNPLIEKNVTGWVEMAKRGDHKALMTDTAEKSYSEKYLRKYRRMYPLLGMLGKPSDYQRFFANAHAILNYQGEDEIEKISCPAFIIGGEEDRIVGPQASYQMKESIRNSELFMYPGLGHGAYEEAKDFYARVFEFLS